MKNIRIFTLLTAVTLGAAFTATTRADDWDKMSKLTFSQPVTVGGTLLQPGTYTFKLVDLPSDRHTVEIMNERQDHVYATILALNTWRDTPTGKTVISFYETPAGQPQALKDWFYPGDNDGQEFINKSRVIEFNRTAETTASTIQPAAPAPAPPPPAVAEAAPAPEPAPAVVEEQQTVIAQNEPPAAAPPAPEVEATTPAPVLPQTASDVPLLTLAGLLSLGAAAGLGSLVKKVG